jgi:hypothetical protein
MKTGEGWQARRSGKALLCMLALSLTWPAGGGAAVEASEPVRLHLKIASQPLDQALQDFARQSGMQIVFFSRITEGLHARPLDGDYTVASALTALLADSPLTFRVLNAKTIEIRPRAGGRSREERPNGASPNSGISG